MFLNNLIVLVCNFCFSNSSYNKANIFLGLVEYELNSLRGANLERYLLIICIQDDLLAIQPVGPSDNIEFEALSNDFVPEKKVNTDKVKIMKCRVTHLYIPMTSEFQVPAFGRTTLMTQASASLGQA